MIFFAQLPCGPVASSYQNLQTLRHSDTPTSKNYLFSNLRRSTPHSLHTPHCVLAIWQRLIRIPGFFCNESWLLDAWRSAFRPGYTSHFTITPPAIPISELTTFTFTCVLELRSGISYTLASHWLPGFTSFIRLLSLLTL